MLAGLLLVFSVVPFLALSTGASAATVTPARSAQADVAGFPLWYQDANGVRVQPCIDRADPNCGAAANPTYNPALPLSFPGNYPNEFFYSVADSQPLFFNECQIGTPVANPGVVVHLALEGAFLNGTLTPGDQMTFGRIRIKALQGAGLCANQWYTFRTPYGPVTLQTNATGVITGAAASASTIDVGCKPGPVTPCDYNTALASQHLQVGLLRQVAGAAAGYLGTGPAGFGAVTGGAGDFNQVDVVKWPVGVAPAQGGLGIDCAAVGCSVLGSTSNFAVAAKLAGPFTAAPSTVDFGGAAVGGVGVTRTITLTNVGGGALGLDPSTIDSLSIGGANLADYSVVSSTCALGAPVARDATCDVVVQYNPFQLGASPATLDVFANGSATPTQVVLAGTGINAGDAPAITVTPFDNLDLGAVRVTNVSAVQTVTIANTGTAPLQIAPVIGGTDAAAFSIGTNTCPTGMVGAGLSCILGIKFVPTLPVPYAAELTITNNSAPGAVYTVGLSAHGTGGNAAVGPTNPVNTFPDWYQDENGVRVGQCDDAANPKCVTSLFQGPTVWPTNYPNEWFYYLAQSSPFAVQDPVCGVNAKPMFVTMANEGAFLGQIAPNQGITFGRIRIVSRGGLCPNTEYQITYPYGQTVIATDSLGAVKPHAGTTDVGCLGPPCDFSIALAAPVFEGFLQQTVHPDGYLGDPLAPSAVTGAPFTDADGLAANYMKVQRIDNGVPGPAIGYTEQFTVSGRLVGPMVASPAAQQFGAVLVNDAHSAVTSTITFTNNGIGDVALGASPLAITGANPLDFTITGTTCGALALLAPAGLCTVDVRFLPTATGPRSAALVLTHDGKNSPLSVSLSGIGNSAGGTAAIAALPASVKFTDLHIGATSESQNIVISNQGGSAALVAGAPTITAGAPFEITGNTCTAAPVAQGGTCVIAARFVPGSVGTFSAVLSVPSNAASGTLSIPLTGKAVNIAPAQSATSNAAGFPSWFQDRNGVRLEQCIAQDTHCVLLQDPGFNPALPVAWPGNFPLESFYALADSQIVNIPVQLCADGSTSAGGSAQLRLATEATFAGVAQATPGAQAWFNRIRVVASGLCANTTYAFQHPYGVTSLTTDGVGAIKAKAGTFDNTNVLGSAPVTPGFVQWDPNVAPLAPAGYLGDGTSYHKIVGSQTPLVPGGEPMNSFKVVSANGVIAQTDKFLVSGRLAGPVVSSLASKDFGTVELTKTASQAFTITNLGSTPVSAFVTTLGGANANQFAITANTCTAAASLATDQSCVITVRFAPTATGAKLATITLGHNGLRSPVTISLIGTAVAASTPALTVTPTSLAFPNTVLGTTSAVQSFTVTNTGTGVSELRLGTIAIGGTNANQYAISSTTCPNVSAATTLKANNSCVVNVTFKPTTSGSKVASIVVSATDVTPIAGRVATVMAPVTVGFTGTGAVGTISASPGSVSIGAVTGKVQTATIKLTNTGTAPFSLVGSPSLFFTAVSTNNPTAKFTAAQTGCNNVAVGKNCSVTVSFTPGAGVVPETFSVNLVVLSNASNGTLTIPVVGTRTR